jgi:hypothetical protein
MEYIWEASVGTSNIYKHIGLQKQP